MTRRTDPPQLFFEQALWSQGLTYIAGLDEAGRGALAGPVAVGAVVLPANDPQLARALDCCRDSKQLTPLQRDRCAPRIRQAALAWEVCYASSDEIDALGIVSATRLAATRALESLSISPDFLLTDFRLDLPESELPQTSVLKGDQVCLSIAAASVLAKTARDRLMCELDARFPGYGLVQNKGYGALAHRTAGGRRLPHAVDH